MSKYILRDVLDTIDECVEHADEEIKICSPDIDYPLGKLVSLLRIKTVIQDYMLAGMLEGEKTGFDE